MDWTKAKTILIIALLATNVFLIYSHQTRHLDVHETGNDEVVAQLMEQRNLELTVEIPKVQPNVHILHGEYLSVDREEIKALAFSVPRVEGGYEKAAEDFLEYLGIFDEAVVYDSTTSGTDRPEGAEYDACVHFVNVVDGLQIAENFIDVYFEEGQVSDMKYRFLDDVELSPRRVETISAAVAVMSLGSETPGEKLVITGIRPVYRVPEADIELGETVSDTAFPAWEITLGSGEKKYVEAVQI